MAHPGPVTLWLEEGQVYVLRGSTQEDMSWDVHVCIHYDAEDRPRERPLCCAMHDQGEPHEPMMLGTCVSGPIKELWLGGFKVA